MRPRATAALNNSSDNIDRVMKQDSQKNLTLDTSQRSYKQGRSNLDNFKSGHVIDAPVIHPKIKLFKDRNFSNHDNLGFNSKCEKVEKKATVKVNSVTQIGGDVPD